MRKIIIPALAVTALTLTGCSSEPEGPSLEEQAQQACLDAVTDRMKDPDSVQFRNITVEDRGETTTNYINEDGTKDENVPGNYWRVEGEVNAKNSFGGMVGFTEFRCEAKKSEGREMETGYLDVD